MGENDVFEFGGILGHFPHIDLQMSHQKTLPQSPGSEIAIGDLGRVQDRGRDRDHSWCKFFPLSKAQHVLHHIDVRGYFICHEDFC